MNNPIQIKAPDPAWVAIAGSFLGAIGGWFLRLERRLSRMLTVRKHEEICKDRNGPLEERVTELEESQTQDQIHFATIVEKLAGFGVAFERHQERMEQHHRDNMNRMESAAQTSDHWRQEVIGPMLRAIEKDNATIKADLSAINTRVTSLEKRRR